MKRKLVISGQTLIEMVIAIGIIVLVILALVLAITVSMRNASFSRNKSLATQYAQQALERLRAIRDQDGWEAFKAVCKPPSFESVPNLEEVPVPFDRIIECDNGDEVRSVTVTVSWTDSVGEHNSELETTLSDWK